MRSLTSRIVLGALVSIAAASTGCGPAERAEPEEAQAELRTEILYDTYDLFDLGDGRAGAFVREPSAMANQPDKTRVLLRLGLGTERSVVLDSNNAPPKTGDVKVDGQGRIYRVERTQNGTGAAFIVLKRVTPSSSRPKTEQLWLRSVNGQRGMDPNLGAPSFDVADDGTTYLAYGEQMRGGGPGVTLVVCKPGQATCTESNVTSENAARYASVAVAIDNGRALVAVRKSDGVAGDIDVFEANASGAVNKLHTVNDAAFAYASVYFARGDGRVVLAAHHKTRGLSLLERESGVFTLKAQLPLHATTRPDLVVSNDGVVVLSRRTLERPDDRGQHPQPGSLELVRVYREADGFKGQDVDLRGTRGAKLLSNGRVFTVKQKSPTMGGVLYEKLEGTALKFRDASRGAGSLEAGRDPCMRGDALAASGFTKIQSSWMASPGAPNGFGHIVTTVPKGEKLVIGPNTCFFGHFIVGEGEVELRGEANKPIHVMRSTIATKTVHATYTFFDEAHSVRLPAGASAPFGLTGSLENVSIARGKDWYGASFSALREDMSAVGGVTNVAALPYRITNDANPHGAGELKAGAAGFQAAGRIRCHGDRCHGDRCHAHRDPTRLVYIMHLIRTST